MTTPEVRIGMLGCGTVGSAVEQHLIRLLNELALHESVICIPCAHQGVTRDATTYLLKDALSDDLIRVAREVHAGGRPLDPEVQARLDTPSQRLTPREMRVLELVFEGHRNKEIAASLTISEDTVEVHLKNIFAKLMVHDRTAAVRVGLSRGIIHMG